MADITKYLGNFLKAGDLENRPPQTVTIAAVVEQKVGKEGESEMKLMLQFSEVEQMLPLNATNTKLLVKFFKSTESNDWIGKKIVIYYDASVTFKGKLVGGIRIRLP